MNIIKYITISIISSSLLAFGITYYTNSTNNIQPSKNIIQNTNDNDYHIDDNIDKNLAKKIIIATENYLDQRIDESIDSRNARLSMFFTSSSPVYNNIKDNIKLNITKSSATITSIKYVESDEDDPRFEVITNTNFYIGNKLDNTQKQQYSVYVEKTSAEDFTPCNIIIGNWL